MLVTTGDVVFAGWAPDALHYTFSLGGPMSLQLGDTGGITSPLVSGTDLRWFNSSEFVFLSGAMGGWTIQRGGSGLPSTPLASPAGDFVDYDVAYR